MKEIKPLTSKINSFSNHGFCISDVNECTATDAALKNLCGVNTKCNNTQGSYTCICDQYYIPDLDGLACSGKLVLLICSFDINHHRGPGMVGWGSRV